MEFVLGIAAAIFFALGTVLQEREAQSVPEDEAMNAGVLLKLARRPIWMAGIAADGLGFICQAAALHFGQLAVVQPLLAASVVFALPFGRFIVHRKVTRKDMIGAAAVTVGLVFFLIMANPEDGVDTASTMSWIISGAIAGGVCAVLVVAARGRSASPRAALLGMSAGILFGFSAGLTLTVVDSLNEGIVDLLTDWHLYALIVVGWISMTLSQAALQTGALPAAVSTQMSLDPVVSVLLGVLIFQESIHDTFLEGAVALLGLAVMIGGLFYLARAQGEEAAAPAPAG
jgi:drug/metabolite transporter (DMT)-like permease